MCSDWFRDVQDNSLLLIECADISYSLPLLFGVLYDRKLKTHSLQPTGSRGPQIKSLVAPHSDPQGVIRDPRIIISAEGLSRRGGPRPPDPGPVSRSYTCPPGPPPRLLIYTLPTLFVFRIIYRARLRRAVLRSGSLAWALADLPAPSDPREEILLVDNRKCYKRFVQYLSRVSNASTTSYIFLLAIVSEEFSHYI